MAKTTKPETPKRKPITPKDRKTTKQPATAPAASGDEKAAAGGEPENALEQLAKELGTPAAHVLDAFLAGTTPDALHADGRTIASGRIVTDCSRIYWQAHAWYKDAPEELRRKVKGFSTPVLTVAVHQALELKTMARGRRDEEVQEAAAQTQAQAVAAQQAAQSADVRDQAERILSRVAGSEEPYATQVSSAVTAVKSAADRVRNLNNLAGVAAGWLKLPKGTPVRTRAELAGIDSAYVKELETIAKNVEKTAAAAEKRATATAVTQRDLDHKDGINLLFLDLIIAAFDAGNQLDKRIPRLQPIATRNFFGRRVRKQDAAPAAPPADK